MSDTTKIPNDGDGAKTPEKTFTQVEVDAMMGKIRAETRTNNDADTAKRLAEMEEKYNSLTYDSSFKNTSFASADEEQRKLIDELTNRDPKKLELLSKTNLSLIKKENEDSKEQLETHFHSGGNKDFTKKDLEAEKEVKEQEKQKNKFQEMFGISTK